MTIFLPGAFTKLLKDFWKIKMQFNFDDDFLRKKRKSPKKVKPPKNNYQSFALKKE
jgi:hypothetical protein